MNSELRKARNVKAMLRRKYNRYPNSTNWEVYRKQRNLVTKLRKRSINKYFEMNCNKSNSSGQFWKIIKPFMFKSGASQNGCFTLYDNDKIVNDDKEICDIFNDHFATCANSIGISQPLADSDTLATVSESFKHHPSILAIKNNANSDHSKVFKFEKVSCDYIEKEIASVCAKKSTGADTLPPRLVKISATSICRPLTKLINMSISSCIFPDILKEAEVSPIFKKDDNTDKHNFRPVSILSCISKIFERTYCNQMVIFLMTCCHLCSVLLERIIAAKLY